MRSILVSVQDSILLLQSLYSRHLGNQSQIYYANLRMSSFCTIHRSRSTQISYQYRGVQHGKC